MIIKDNDIIIRQADKSAGSSERSDQNFNDLKMLSEVRMHPDKMPGEIVFYIEKQGKTIGEVSLHTIRWYNRKAMLSILIDDEERRSGTGKRVLSLVMEYVFNVMNLHRLSAEVFAYNEPGQRLFKSLGFKKEGILREARFMDGKYFDIIVFGMLRSEFKKY